MVEVDHPTRGKYLSVGNPIKLSGSPADVKRSPLLGEYTDEILREVLGFSDHQVAESTTPVRWIRPVRKRRSKRRRSAREVSHGAIAGE